MTALAPFEFAPQPSMVVRAMEKGTETLVVKDPIRPLVEYQDNPIGFITEKLHVPMRTLRWSINEGYGEHTWDGTRDPLVAILDGLRTGKDVCVESGTGTGKSFIIACVILWFLACWEDARVFTFAPTAKQLQLYSWKEVRRLWPRFKAMFPTAILLDLTIRVRGGMDDSWGAKGFPVGQRAGEEVSVNAAGMHAEHMLLIYDETPGIPMSVIEAGENTCTAPHNLRVAVGNPDFQLDALHLFGYDEFGQPREGVDCITVSSLDHPNIVCKDPSLVAGAVSAKSIRKRLLKYGKDGKLYKSRVRGISPPEAHNALIKLEWVHAAQARAQNPADRKIMEQGKRSLGIDVANSPDGDEGAIARGKGALLETVESFPCPNANDLGIRIALEMREERILDEHVGIDVVGVGVGAYNELTKRDRWVTGISGAKTMEGRPDEEELYNNVRSQVMYVMREDLRLNRIAIAPNDVELVRDLITPTYKTRNGKIIVESKEDLKKRLPGGRSPNKGDAACYWNWVRDRDGQAALLVENIPKRNLTVQERIKKELEDLDKEDARVYGDQVEDYDVMRQ